MLSDDICEHILNPEQINIKCLQEILNQQDQGKELNRKKQEIKKIKFPEGKSHTHIMNTNN